MPSNLVARRHFDPWAVARCNLVKINSSALRVCGFREGHRGRCQYVDPRWY